MGFLACGIDPAAPSRMPSAFRWLRAARAVGTPDHSGGSAPASHRTSPTHRPWAYVEWHPTARGTGEPDEDLHAPGGLGGDAARRDEPGAGDAYAHRGLRRDRRAEMADRGGAQ